MTLLIWEFWHDGRVMALVLVTGFFFLLLIGLYRS
jgi:hypothetical protein